MNYIEKKKEYLSKFVKKNDGVHNHVHDINHSNDNVLDSIKNYGYEIIHNEKATLFLKNDRNCFKLDSRANNTTSSSMLSASFFAFLVENPNYFEQFIRKIIDDNTSIITNKQVITEYKDVYGDKSVIDAFITCDVNGKKSKIFIETKYLESAYGKKNKFHTSKQTADEQALNKIKYIEHTKKTFENHKKILKIDDYLDLSINNFDEIYDSKYVKYYQIIRNVSHASINQNCFVVFLLDKNNQNSFDDITNGLDLLKINNKTLIDTRVKILSFTELDFLPLDMKTKYFYNE